MDEQFSQIDFGPLKQFLDNDDITDISYDNNGQVWLKSLSKGVYRVENTGIDNALMEKIAFQCANSMAPGSYINIYYKSLNDDGEVMFGKFISNIEVLDVKDSSGRHVFEKSEEARTPAYMLFAVPEETHLLLRKALYLKNYDVELLLIPNTATLTEDQKVTVSSLQIEEFINSKTAFVSVDDLPQVSEGVTEDTGNNETNNQ